MGDIKKYMFNTSSVEIFAVTEATGIRDLSQYLIVVRQSHRPTRYYQFNDGYHPYRLAFDCQRGVMSIATAMGTFEKKLADIGVQVSARYDPNATPAPVQIPGLDCNEVESVPLTKAKARFTYAGRLYNSDYAFGEWTSKDIDGNMLTMGDVNKYLFKTSSVEILALDGTTTSINDNTYLIVVRQSHQPTRYYQFNDGRFPHRLTFDCQRGVVSIATQQGIIEKQFAAIGVHVSAHFDPNATPTAVQVPGVGQ